MMNEIGGANRKPSIPCRGLHEDLFEWRLIKYFSIGHAIERHPASQAYGLLPGSGVQRSQHLEQDLFQARLERGRAIAMHLLDRSGGIARSAKAFGHIVGEHRAQLGSLAGIAPGHLRSGAMVFEIVETESEADASVGA